MPRCRPLMQICADHLQLLCADVPPEVANRAAALTGAIDDQGGPLRGAPAAKQRLHSQFQLFARTRHRLTDRLGAIECPIGSMAAVYEAARNGATFAMLAPGCCEQADQTKEADAAKRLNTG